MKPSQISLLRLCAGLILILGLTSCASISVKKDSESTAVTMPHKIYVSTFNMKSGVFNVDRDGPELKEFKTKLQQEMQQDLISDLNLHLLPTVAGTKGHEFDPESGWLIRGEFIKVNQGSRFLRTAIGLGAGGTKMETKIYVYDLSSDTGFPILTFSTTGGSGAEPGAATALSTDPLIFAIGVGLGGLPGAAHGITEDTRRTAHMITAQLSDYLHQHGWISDAQWIKPKVLN